MERLGVSLLPTQMGCWFTAPQPPPPVFQMPRKSTAGTQRATPYTVFCLFVCFAFFLIDKDSVIDIAATPEKLN